MDGSPGANPLLQERTMYALDLVDSTDAELEKSVADWCSQFGSVRSVRMSKRSLDRSYATAFVSMSSTVDLQKVLLCIGDSSAEVEALIVLDQ